MADPADAHFACPHCDRRFRWKRELAGRGVKCKCGGQFRVPDEPGHTAPPLESTAAHRAPRHESSPAPSQPEGQPQGEGESASEDDQTYALDVPGDDAAGDRPSSASADNQRAAASAAQTGRCPNCNQSIKPNAVICVKCGFNLKEGRKMEVEVDADTTSDAPADDAAPTKQKKQKKHQDSDQAPQAAVDPRKATAAGVGFIGDTASAETEAALAKRQLIIDWILPPVLIVLGVAMELIYQLYFSDDRINSPIGAVIAVVVTVVIWAPILLLLLVVTAKLFDMNFGTLGPAILKLMGIALLPGAIWSFLSGAFMGGWFAGLTVAAFMYWIMFLVLFSIEAIEAMNLSVALLVLQLWVVPLITIFIIGFILAFLI
ncbi:MAG: hypothetical protein ACODAQ_11715 [Phycisphaeraceae bacterium]